MSFDYWPTEAQFCKIRPLLLKKPRGIVHVDVQQVLSGIIYCL